MRKTPPLLLTLLLASSVATAQSPYDTVLRQIEQNSVTLEALRADAEARRAQSRTGLAPADPEVEFGYLWGRPAAGGDRKDISVRQTFDFPSVYHRRLRLADGQERSSEWAYRTERMDLLLEAERTCIRLVCCNALYALYVEQADRLRQAAEAEAQRLEIGESSRTDYNKAVLQHTQAEAGAQRIRLEQERLSADLEAMNGGRPIVADLSDYPPRPALPGDFEAWYIAAEAAHPALQYLKAQAEVAEREVGLTRAETLPRLSVGYMGEFVPGQRYQGVTAGMSLPLWERRNRLQQAHAEARASEQRMDDARLRYYRRLNTLHAEASSLTATIARYDSLLTCHDNAALLHTAFHLGELPLSQYVQELEFGLAVRVALIETRRDLELVRAELEAYNL